MRAGESLPAERLTVTLAATGISGLSVHRANDERRSNSTSGQRRRLIGVGVSPQIKRRRYRMLKTETMCISFSPLLRQSLRLGAVRRHQDDIKASACLAFEQQIPSSRLSRRNAVQTHRRPAGQLRLALVPVNQPSMDQGAGNQ